MKRPDGITVLSVYHFVVGAILALCVCAVLAILVAAFLDGSPDAAIAGIVLALAAVMLFIFLAANVAAGWALLKMQAWGRWLAIALAAISLPGFPVGTAIGGTSIWYLLQPQIKDAFQGPIITEGE
ncbi:MAG: hypothetical protein L6435_14700 [Anaerolineae bacterium]|nr:hypothetical protein [Anaerolineae bacterium]